MGLVVDLLLALWLRNELNTHANKDGKINNTFTYTEVIDTRINLFKNFELTFSTTLQNLSERVRTFNNGFLDIPAIIVI